MIFFQTNEIKLQARFSLGQEGTSNFNFFPNYSPYLPPLTRNLTGPKEMLRWPQITSKREKELILNVPTSWIFLCSYQISPISTTESLTLRSSHKYSRKNKASYTFHEWQFGWQCAQIQRRFGGKVCWIQKTVESCVDAWMSTMMSNKVCK